MNNNNHHSTTTELPPQLAGSNGGAQLPPQSDVLTGESTDRLAHQREQNGLGTQLELKFDELDHNYALTHTPAEDRSSIAPPAKDRFGLLKKVGLGLAGVGLLGGLVYVVQRAGNSAPQKAEKFGGKGKATLVTVASVTQKTVPIQLQAIGSVLPGSTVAVTPQASGRITGVYFKKGQEVNKGQLLFTLDNQSQSAAIQQAQGTLGKDQALIEQAQATLAKDRGAIEQAKATLAKDQAQVQQVRANLAKDRGAIEQAKATLAKDRGLVRQAQATLAKDEATAQFTKSQSDRYGNLFKQGAVSQDQAQQYSTNSRVSSATLQADREAISNAQSVVQGDIIAIANAGSVVQGDLAAVQSAEAVVRGDIIAIQNAGAVVQGDLAAIENARSVANSDRAALKTVEVQQSYTKIYAPISGRAGNILVMPGNVVQTNSTSPLVSIAQTHPIQVGFAIPERQLPEVKKYMQNGKLQVNVTFAGDKTSQMPGVLSFINNTVDPTTGTIQLIGDFDNATGQLFPGQYVNTNLTLTQQVNATVVPSQAVQNGPKGQFVFKVQEDHTVANVPVKIGNTVDGFAVVSQGLKPGDSVVTDGQANLVDGGKIRLNGAGGDAPGAGSRDRPRRKRSADG
jgi:membrane fusion protein, multidrug efflux system